jgi:phosphate transport system substrate-binding protein
VILLAACGEPITTPEPVYLQAAGSTSMVPLVAELAAAFHAQNPVVNLEVSGSGSHFGVEALRAGEVDVALIAWLSPDEAAGWRATAIARDGIAIIVHPANPVHGLGLLQLQDLFSGRIYDWGALGGRSDWPVVPVSREDGSGLRAAFETLAMGDRTVTPRAMVALSSLAVVDIVASQPQAIGYVAMADVGADAEVRVLKIEEELPTPQSTGRASYVLSHELWLVTADPASEAVQAFVDFAAGPAGQEIVARYYGRVR